MAKVLMLTSSFPKYEGDTCGVFVSTLFQALVQRYPINVLIPNAKEDMPKRDGVHTFGYFIPSLQGLAYGFGILNNIKQKPWLILQVPFYILAQLLALRRLVKQDPDIKILHAHWWIPQGLSAVLCKTLFFPKLKIVCTLHGSDYFVLKGFFWHKVREFVLQETTLTITTSTKAQDAICSHHRVKNKVITFPAGIRPEVFRFKPRRLDRTHPRLLFVGRLVTEKGVWDLLKALTILRLSISAFTLTIIGEGKERTRIDRYIQEEDLLRYTRLQGVVNNAKLSQCYHEADVLILPSYTEGLPVVLMEAMAAGTLVIATPVGGIPELVRDGQTGFLTQPGDPKGLAEIILRIYLDYGEDQLHLIRRQAHQEVIEGDYNLNNQIEKLLFLYEELYHSS